MNLFDFIDEIYCLNLGRRTDRWQECIAEFNRIGINNKVIRYPAIEIPNVPAILLNQISMLSLLTLAKKKKLKNFLFLEDDVKFIGDTLDILSKSLEQIKELNWKMLYLGANLSRKLNRVSDNLFQLKGGLSSHAILFNSTFFDECIDKLLKTQELYTDVLFRELQETNDCYVVYPLLATQRRSFSDVENREVDYTFIETYYKKYTE